MRVIAAVAVALWAGMAQSAAAAESCGVDGRVCVLADLSQPRTLGETLVARVPSETTKLAGTGVARPRLVGVDPVAQTSLWEFECCPHAGSNVLRIWAQTQASGTIASAEFQVTAVSFAGPVRLRVKREGKWLTARWAFRPRVPVKGLFTLQAYGPRPTLSRGKLKPTLIPRGKPARRLVKANGRRRVRVVVRISMSALWRACKRQPYCQWTTEQTLRRVDNGAVLPESLRSRTGPRKAPAFFSPPF